MSFPTWGDLFDNYCSHTTIKTSLGLKQNLFYEEFARRRYNPSPISDTSCCRLVFLKDVLHNPTNKTLCRQGRFIWCKNLHYEGRDDNGYRQISFTIDKGKKRFKVSEKNMLCLPSKVFIHNNRYFRSNSVGDTKQNMSGRDHPCGIILGKSLVDNDYVGREFYRVRFGNTTYEKVHPVQMEILNEV